MSWLRRLLPGTEPAKSKNARDISRLRDGGKTLTKEVQALLKRTIAELPEIIKAHRQDVYEAACRCIAVGGDQQVLYRALAKIEGLPKTRAIEICLFLNRRANAQIDKEQKMALGLSGAIWVYAGAPCFFSDNPTPAEIEQDASHCAANGKKFDVSKGLFIDGKWTWPGVERGCKCALRSVLPDFENFDQ